MNILFITSGPLGDTVLCTGLVDYLTRRYPDSKVTLVTGMLGISLFEGLENIEKSWVLIKKPYHLHWWDLWCKVAGKRWDIVVDMRNSPVSRIIRASKRYIKIKKSYNPQDHLVIQNAKVLGLSDKPPSPKIWLSETQKQKAQELLPEQGLYLGIGPTANFPGKMWPSSYFIDLLSRLTEEQNIFSRYKIVIFGAPHEKAQATPIIKALPSEQVVDLVGKTNPGLAAACLNLCNFYIGNDSGLTHCAAALDVPTLALFGPSRTENYHPWGGHCDFIRTPESRDELIGQKDFDASKITESMMHNLTVEYVEAKIYQMLDQKL